MPRRMAPKSQIPKDADPESLFGMIRPFLEWLRVRGYAERTVENRESYACFFAAWCEERGVTRPQEVTRALIEQYQRHLYHLRKKDGKPMSFQSQHTRLLPVRAYFKWLTRQNHILYNPASEMEMPKMEKRLPKHILTPHEAEAVLSQPDVKDPFGIRDRAMLEVLYSTGIRRMEVVNLGLYDLDEERGTLMVRQGKGKKDRMVPIGERAIAWIQKYLFEVRPRLTVGVDCGSLFLTKEGESFSPGRLTQLVREYVDEAEVGKTGSCHLFRHTVATLMLENGADIRYIQQMLGHAELSTTEIYTQVSIRKLKEIHTLTHPAGREAYLKPVAHPELIAELEEENQEEEEALIP